MCATNKRDLQKNTAIKRIGLYGGTFDPPHIGHLIIAETAWQQLALDKVLFIPAYIPPHKKGKKYTTPQQRLEMLQCAIRGNKHFDILDIELKRRGVSYTADTLFQLKQLYPFYEFFLIIGSDNLLQFSTWKEPEKILKLSKLVVYERPSYTLQSKHRTFAYIINGPMLDISSTFIRRLVRTEQSIRYLVPQSVEQYITNHLLYK